MATIVADLRSEGSDVADVEVKRAAGGFPGDVATTISAFANQPGGGLLIFGLDENRDFEATGVYDAAACQAALASVARNGVEPPVRVTSRRVGFEGADLVVAEVIELPGPDKPARVKGTGKAYLRSYDGDYELSALEVQAFIANRETPRFDQEAVPGTSSADLDPKLVAAYLGSCRASSQSLDQMSDEQILFRTGVTVGDSRTPTIAGLLSLGLYPQQQFPNFVIQAHVAPSPSDPPGTRAVDPRRFDGPIPVMLDGVLRWVERNTRSRIRFGRDGHGRDEREYPVEAVRELLGNALVHRDLGPYARNEAVTLRLERDQLVVSNPGGLWGLTVDRLGRTGVTSARNGWLVRICQNVRFGDERRVIEALATGIPTVLRSLQAAGMAPPRFHDQGIKFVVRVPNHTLLAPDDVAWLSRLPGQLQLNDTQRHVLVAMLHGEEWSNKSLRDAFPMDSREARTLLLDLVRQGAAVAVGERGMRVYVLSDSMRRTVPALEEPLWPLETTHPAPVSEEPDVGHRDNRQLILDLLSLGSATRAELAAGTTLTNRQVGYALESLRAEGLVRLAGGPGVRSSRYELSP